MDEFQEDVREDKDVISNSIPPKEKTALTKMVKEVNDLEAQKKDVGFRLKELLDGAFEKTGLQGKAVKQLAKISRMDEVEREKQRQIEEDIDRGKVALGLLADTPLGQAEIQRMESEKQQSVKSGNAKKRSKGKAEQRVN